MVGVAGRAVAGDFGQDRRAARGGVLAIFEHEHPCAFAEDEAVAVGGEGAGGLGGIVPAAGGDDAHFLEGGEDAAGDGGIGAAGEHHGDGAGCG